MTREAHIAGSGKADPQSMVDPVHGGERLQEKWDRIYSKSLGQMLHVADIQQSFSNSQGSPSASRLNCGVHIPGVWSHFTKGPEPTKIEGARLDRHSTGDSRACPNAACLVGHAVVRWPEKDAEVIRIYASDCRRGSFHFSIDFQSKPTVASFFRQPRNKGGPTN
jgi:hypothetical protein